MDDHPRPVLRTFIAGVAGLTALATLAACSSGNGSTSSTTASASTAFSTIPIQTTTTTAPAAAPGQGGAATTAAAGAAGSGGTYTVVSGDYPIGVAKKLGVTLQALLDANGMTLASFNLVPGQKLKIPSSTTGSTTASTAAGSGSSGSTGSTASSAASTTTTFPPDAPGTYTVRSGDAWSLVASKLGVDVNDLAAFNDKTLNSVLIPGMKLKVPPARTTTTTVKP
jgi:N-acetylmuramoyl-L-alanine amidase